MINNKPYKNPIIPNNAKNNTADPYVIKHGGYYYHCYANEEGVFVTKSEKLWDIADGEEIKVYDCQAESSLKSWFAPELHQIDNKWYIYAAPDYGNGLHTMTVLVCDSESPMGEYKLLGTVNGLEGKWTIDGTILRYHDEIYFVWTSCVEIYIAKMSDPSSITGKITVISTPKYQFETLEGIINEGPAVLYKNDKIYIVYSANDSRCDDYCLGLLTFGGGDILDAGNWEKIPETIFRKTDTIYGPGHCSFTTVTENGAEVDYIVYHANLVSGSGWYGRNVFIQPFDWKDDKPNFGEPFF